MWNAGWAHIHHSQNNHGGGNGWVASAHAVAFSVIIEPGTMLAGIAKKESWEVNSRHHQAVAGLGKGLRVCAKDADDGTIEGIELPGRRYVLAVPWHPENQQANDPEQRKLFESFAQCL